MREHERSRCHARGALHLLAVPRLLEHVEHREGSLRAGECHPLIGRRRSKPRYPDPASDTLHLPLLAPSPVGTCGPRAAPAPQGDVRTMRHPSVSATESSNRSWPLPLVPVSQSTAVEAVFLELRLECPVQCRDRYRRNSRIRALMPSRSMRRLALVCGCHALTTRPTSPCWSPCGSPSPGVSEGDGSRTGADLDVSRSRKGILDVHPLVL
jgi:hypothetical protein